MIETLLALPPAVPDEPRERLLKPGEIGYRFGDEFSPYEDAMTMVRALETQQGALEAEFPPDLVLAAKEVARQRVNDMALAVTPRANRLIMTLPEEIINEEADWDVFEEMVREATLHESGKRGLHEFSIDEGIIARAALRKLATDLNAEAKLLELLTAKERFDYYAQTDPFRALPRVTEAMIASARIDAENERQNRVLATSILQRQIMPARKDDISKEAALKADRANQDSTPVGRTRRSTALEFMSRTRPAGRHRKAEPTRPGRTSGLRRRLLRRGPQDSRDDNTLAA